MTEHLTEPPGTAVRVQIQRDAQGQYVNLPAGWEFPGDKALAQKVESGLLLLPVRARKPKKSNPPAIKIT